jgi:hypothetical protein
LSQKGKKDTLNFTLQVRAWYSPVSWV